MGNRYTPETGYPSVPLGQDRPEDDIYVFADGREMTGADFNRTIAKYLSSERGQAVLRGEAEPLATIVGGDPNNPGASVFLGQSNVEVSDIDPLLKQTAEEILGE